MNFNSLRKEITSNNASVKELVNDIFAKIEDKGISLLTQKKCDFILNIPLKGKTSSLNASVAAAISLFHLTSR